MLLCLPVKNCKDYPALKHQGPHLHAESIFVRPSRRCALPRLYCYSCRRRHLKCMFYLLPLFIQRLLTRHDKDSVRVFYKSACWTAESGTDRPLYWVHLARARLLITWPTSARATSSFKVTRFVQRRSSAQLARVHWLFDFLSSLSGLLPLRLFWPLNPEISKAVFPKSFSTKESFFHFIGPVRVCRTFFFTLYLCN